MHELSTELAELELEGLDLNTLEIQTVESTQGLELLTTGHGMVEIGASAFETACCSCCLPCCCCA